MSDLRGDRGLDTCLLFGHKTLGLSDVTERSRHLMGAARFTAMRHNENSMADPEPHLPPNDPDPGQFPPQPLPVPTPEPEEPGPDVINPRPEPLPA
jgi:hypothetical protein